MHVLRLHKAGDLRLHDEPVPVPSEHEELLRVTAVGICGSDLHWLEEGGIGDEQVERPFVLGHEFAATVASGPREGMRVAVDPAIPCWKCRYCERGDTNLCVHLRFAGHMTQDGGLRKYMTWPRARLHPLPDTLTDEEGALLEPLGVALHAVDLGKIRRGSRVGIFGCGPIGLLIQQVAALQGGEVVVATDPIAHRRDASRAFGAKVTLDSTDEEYLRRLSSAVGTDGVDVAFEASNDHHAIQAAVAASSRGGRVVITGIPSSDRLILEASVARRKGLTLLLTRRMREMYERTIQMATKREVDLASLVTDRFPLTAFEAAFGQALSRTGHKVIINP